MGMAMEIRSPCRSRWVFICKFLRNHQWPCSAQFVDRGPRTAGMLSLPRRALPISIPGSEEDANGEELPGFISRPRTDCPLRRGQDVPNRGSPLTQECAGERATAME